MFPVFSQWGNYEELPYSLLRGLVTLYGWWIGRGGKTECADHTLHCSFCGVAPKGESGNQNLEHLFSRNFCLSLPLDIYWYVASGLQELVHSAGANVDILH